MVHNLYKFFVLVTTMQSGRWQQVSAVYLGETEVPLVADVSEVLIVQVVCLVATCGALGSVHRLKPREAPALLNSNLFD